MIKKILITLILFSSFLFADNVKELSLACQTPNVLIDLKELEKKARDGAIPQDCLLLTSNAKLTVVGEEKNHPHILKVLIIDLGTYVYILKEDVIITNENKI